jgi:hypothetical protein
MTERRFSDQVVSVARMFGWSKLCYNVCKNAPARMQPSGAHHGGDRDAQTAYHASCFRGVPDVRDSVRSQRNGYRAGASQVLFSCVLRRDSPRCRVTPCPGALLGEGGQERACFCRTTGPWSVLVVDRVYRQADRLRQVSRPEKEPDGSSLDLRAGGGRDSAGLRARPSLSSPSLRELRRPSRVGAPAGQHATRAVAQCVASPREDLPTWP